MPPPSLDDDPASVSHPEPFEATVSRTTRALFAQARAALGAAPRDLVVDPFIESSAGARTVATAVAVAHVESAVPAPWTLRPLTRETLRDKPLLVIGSLSPAHARPEDAGDSRPDAFRLWLTLIDLRNWQLVAKVSGLAVSGTVDIAPSPYFRDSPARHLDKFADSYLQSAGGGSRVGEQGDAYYLVRLPASSLINEAIRAYDRGFLPMAAQLFDEASPFAGQADLRVLNGLYASHWRIGQRDEARAALGKLVSAGLAARSLPMKLSFQAGSAAFDRGGDLPEQHGLWIRMVADQLAPGAACLRVVGHAVRAGDPGARRSLALERAEAVRWLMAQVQPALAHRLSAEGAASIDAAGDGEREDARGGLTHPIEFRVVDCR